MPKALQDLFHFVFLSLTVLLICVFSDIADTHLAAITLGYAFTMARTISYTLVCSVTHMKFQQIQPSVLVYTLVYSSNRFVIQFMCCFARSSSVRKLSYTE